MSIQSVQSNIDSIQRDIQNLQQKLAKKSREEASKLSRIAQIQRSITKQTNLSLIESKLRDVRRIESEMVRLKSEIANINKQITEKTGRLHRYQQDLYNEQAKEQRKQTKEQEKLLKTLEQKQKDEFRRQQSDIAKTILSSQPFSFLPIMQTADLEPVRLHDVFISHASEDKQEIARPLADALSVLGYDVWYDEFQLKIGDSLRRTIDKGLANSRFGVVIFSPSFFAKNWTQYELDGLVQREISSGKVILPVWHKISKNEVLSYSPSLADKFAMSTAHYTIDELATAISEVLNPE